MNLSRILEKGYLPKELPPPFNSKSFGKKSRYILKNWKNYESFLKTPLTSENNSNKKAKARYKPILEKYETSKLFEFNISKGQYSRRKIEIPHPLAYLKLCEKIVINWSLINKTFRISKFSESRLYSETGTKRSVRTKSKSWGKFKNKLTEISFNYKVQLKLDISSFYGTIYTHSIPWSLLGKEKSKIYYHLKNNNSNDFINLTLTDSDAKKYHIGDQIDTLVRNCNDKQSVGIPIGPDSSFILSEMLASRLDKSIADKIDTIDYKCVRYYDDYYFYVNSVGDAENILKKFQKTIYEYKLEMNESKVQIKKLPYFQSDLWSIEIHNFKFKSSLIDDINELELFFSLIFKLTDQYPNNTSWVLSYSLSSFELGKVKIKKELLNTFITLLLKSIYLDTSSIDQVFKIILSYKPLIKPTDLKRIKLLLDKLIKEHILLNHSFETAWCLWYYRSLGINCKIETLQSILNSDDQCSILIALDIINQQNIRKTKFDFTTLYSKISLDNLYGKYWLLCYECEIKNWLPFNLDIIKDHKFFKILQDLNITFYNVDAQVKTKFIIPTSLIQPNLNLDFPDLWPIPNISHEDENEEEEEEEEEGDY